MTDAPGGYGRRARRVRTRLPVSMAALAGSVVVVVLTWLALRTFVGSLGVEGSALALWTALAWLCAVAVLGLVVPGVMAVVRSVEAGRLDAAGNKPDARLAAEKAKDWSWYVAGIGLTVLIAAFLLWFCSVDDAVIRRTFFNGTLLWNSIPQIWKGFQLNIKIFLAAEVLVLIFGLLLAVARLFPGRPGAPVRFLATTYTDVFRGFPAVVVLYLFVLGVQTAGLPEKIPGFSSLSRSDQQFWLIVIALVLVYSAYVGEVYRAGLDSIHWSQTAAARSLGLGRGQSLRYVIVPQAVRRIMPPLLNDFIGLQKDTALVSFVGALDAVARARFIANTKFNLSPIVGAGLAFLIITIPLARFTDLLMRRDQERMRAGGS